MMWPVADFYDGKRTASRPKKCSSANIPSKIVDDTIWREFSLKGRNWQHFLFSPSENMSSDQVEFVNLFQELRPAIRWRTTLTRRRLSHLTDEPLLSTSLHLPRHTSTPSPTGLVPFRFVWPIQVRPIPTRNGCHSRQDCQEPHLER